MRQHQFKGLDGLAIIMYLSFDAWLRATSGYVVLQLEQHAIPEVGLLNYDTRCMDSKGKRGLLGVPSSSLVIQQLYLQ